MSSEKRSHDRMTINKEFESFDAFIQEYVTNISRTGVFVRAHDPLAIGTRVNLRFTVIMDDIETIEGVGEVVRIEKDGMGVVFRELSSYSRGLIEKMLTQGHEPSHEPSPEPAPEPGQETAAVSKPEETP